MPETLLNVINKNITMKAIIKNNVKPFFASCFIFAGGLQLYLELVGQQNKNEHDERMKNEKLNKDTTRPQNEYFGINWGYAADAMVKDKFDTGDLVFMKFECWNYFEGSNIRNCIWNRFMNPYPHLDSIGLVYRDYDTMKIVFNEFGKIRQDDYTELLQYPYISELSARKLILKDPAKSKLIQKDCRKFLTEIENQRMSQSMFIYRILNDCLDTFAEEWKLKKEKCLKELIPEDVNIQTPPFFKTDLRLNQSVCIRSRTNQELAG